MVFQSNGPRAAILGADIQKVSGSREPAINLYQDARQSPRIRKALLSRPVGVKEKGGAHAPPRCFGPARVLVLRNGDVIRADVVANVNTGISGSVERVTLQEVRVA